MKNTRLNPHIRKTQLLEIAVDYAKKFGYTNVTPKLIADKAHVRATLVHNYFSTMRELRKLIMQTAIDRNILPIIAQGIAFKDPLALNVSAEIKQRAIQYLSN